MPSILVSEKEAEVAVSRRAATSKQWQFPSDCQVDDSIIDVCMGSDVLARLLIKRGLRTPSEIAAFLNPTQYESAGPSEFAHMSQATARIFKAIAEKEKITVYGDYDVDGVTATAVMVTTLNRLGAQADYYIPTRTEGYGLNLKAVSVLASKHRSKLIISCDCGISNFSEINFARSLGVDTIIVDHHTMPELLPPAVAILHPKQLPEDHKLYHLPGVGVAFKLAQALLAERGEAEKDVELLDLVTLGMIADMVPLVKECRYLVQIGMPKLVGSSRAGIKALLGQVGGREGGTDLVGFGLAPRINAVGRLADANTAVRLMVTEDEEEAGRLAQQLELENVRRQELCEEIFAKAEQAVQASMKPEDRAIAIYSEGWHHGVVGIVASRLVEKYRCPVFIGELDSAEGIVKGSARGVDGIDLYDVLKANEQLAMKWGGHKMAAGFSVEAAKAPAFCQAIVATCNQMLAGKPAYATLDIDLEIPPEAMTGSLTQLLAKAAPFGIGNKKPVIAMKALKCVGTRALGKEGKHSRINVKAASGELFECVYWNSQQRIPQDEQIVDIAFSPEMNHYNGTSRLQLVLNDWRDPKQPVVSPVVSEPAAAPGVANTSAAPVERAAYMPPLQTGRSSAEESGMPPAPSTQSAGAPQGGRDSSQAAPLPPVHRSIDMSPASALAFKDLRNHSSPQDILQAATRKLGAGFNLFAEGQTSPLGQTPADRASLQPSAHLLIWQYPPALQVFKEIILKSSATQVYLIGGAPVVNESASAFLKRLLGLVRFAVNQRDGTADPQRVAAALSTTKMAIALGLAILKKINVIDWFAEDGCIYLDIVGQPASQPDELAEFKQLSTCLTQISEFRTWCHATAISEIQLALSAERDVQREANARSETLNRPAEDTSSGIYQHDTANQLPSTFS